IEQYQPSLCKPTKSVEVNNIKKYLINLSNKNNTLTKNNFLSFIVGAGIFTVTLASLLILPRFSVLDRFKPCKTFLDPDRLDKTPTRCLENSQLKSEFVTAFTDRGDTLYDDEKFAEALKSYETANDINPNNSTVLTGIGKAYYKLYSFKEGDEFYKKATQTDPESAIEWNSYGDAFYALGRIEEARTAYKKATDLDGNRQAFWIELGDVLDKLGREEEAVDSYEKAIDLNPDEKDRIRAWNGKGKALFGLNNLDEARNAFEEAQAIDFNDPKPWYYKGLVSDKLGEKRKAQNAYETVIDKCDRLLDNQPNNLEILSQKAEALGKLKKNEDALEIWNDITDKYPTYFPAQINRANLLFFVGKYDEALVEIDKAIENTPEWKLPEVLVNKGSFLIGRRSKDKSQDLKAAVEAFTQALEINPNFVRALQDRGQAYMDFGKLQEALNDSERAVQIDNQDAKSWVLRGAVLAKMGRNEDALTSIEGGIRLNESDPTAWWQKGILLEKLKLENEALEAYDRAIKLSPAFQPAIDARSKLQEKLEMEKINPSPSPEERTSTQSETPLNSNSELDNSTMPNE
ncbi:MAG: tetratricopeptide repeat protein, partial [Geitlerinemataceae cyanobacterium]